MPSDGAASRRARFTPDEAREVLGAFAVPKPRRIREYRRGSARSPKALVECIDGSRYLLKRRDLPGTGTRRVEFIHEVHAALVRMQFPVPSLVPLRDSGSTWLGRRGAVYELFEFMEGDVYDRSPKGALEAGRLLSQWHVALEAWAATAGRPSWLYHRSAAVDSAWHVLASSDGRLTERGEALASTLRQLRDRMDAAALLADSHVSIPGSPGAAHVLHGDFHPGNVLYRNGSPLAVLDLDSARPGHRLLDVANAAMQFALEPLGDGPEASWTVMLQLPRLEAFLRGYAAATALRLGAGDAAAMPALMVEASIAESVPRIARVGMFGRIEGGAFLRHVNRKTASIWERREALTTLCLRCMESA